MPDANGVISEIAAYDRDSIHTLPLSIIPLKTAGLAKARLIKNVRLETRIELFRDRGTGSGQIGIEEIGDFFGEEPGLEDDVALILRLGELPAFDPYTLRIGLREARVDVLDLAAFQLSAAKMAELVPLMRNITRPLMRYLYGDKEVDANDIDTLIRRVADPDTPMVRARIQTMAKALKTDIDTLPGMLEGYGDTGLALTYYRGYFHDALPVIDRMLVWINDIQDSSVVRHDQTVQRSLAKVEEVLTRVTGSVTHRFNGFDRETVIQWDQVSLDTFEAVRALVSRHQRSLAEVLCGLTVKLYEWEERFPHGGGSPDKRLDFISADLKPGLDHLLAVERRAPKFAGHEAA